MTTNINYMQPLDTDKAQLEQLSFTFKKNLDSKGWSNSSNYTITDSTLEDNLPNWYKNGGFTIIGTPIYTGSNVSGENLPVRIYKSWGWEIIFVNNYNYCGKQLVINPLHHTSMHFHLNKHETMYIIEGTLYIDCIIDKQTETFVLTKGASFTIAPGLVHSLRAEKDSVTLIEVSTQSADKDSIRIS